MSIPPVIVSSAKKAWRWQWNQLMNGLAPADQDGNYCRKESQAKEAKPPSKIDLLNRNSEELPILIIGRSCPWAHRTWLLYELKNLKNKLNLLIAEPDYEAGLWKIKPNWMGCENLLEIYKLCGSEPALRATVPALIDPKINKKPILLGNESAQLVEALNIWPTQDEYPDFFPSDLREEINKWQDIIQESVNNGVYKCGFARNQSSYEKASEELFNALNILEKSLSSKGPWLCGEKITLADIRLFPTMIRWESIYAPLFGCSQKPLVSFPNIVNWIKNFYSIPNVSSTCNAKNWRNDYFGALFPLNPNNVVPRGPTIKEIINNF